MIRRQDIFIIALIASAFFLGGFSNHGWSSDQKENDPTINRWVKLYEQKPDDVVSFRRQEHGGSCFDSKRGRLILFGSDTHGQDWTNSPLMFDVKSLHWSQAYPNDDRNTYAVNEKGIPVAGVMGLHPWAMHTFGAVVYDPSRDEMVVASSPKHMIPGRFTDSVKDLWPKITTFPTWTFNLEIKHWSPLSGKAVDFFPYCTAFDTDRNVVLGYRADGIYELSGEPRSWKRLTKKAFIGGWSNNCAYDSQNRALIIFGTNTMSNDVEVYFPQSGKHQIMPTRGLRPPKDQHTPMAYHPGVNKTIVIADHKLDQGKIVGETWLYDLEKDVWTNITTATLPFGCGMNYNLEYDSHHDRLLLVTGVYPLATTVWELKVQNSL